MVRAAVDRPKIWGSDNDMPNYIWGLHLVITSWQYNLLFAYKWIINFHVSFTLAITVSRTDSRGHEKFGGFVPGHKARGAPTSGIH